MRQENPIALAEIERLVPSAFNKTVHPDRSERYVHMPTSELITAMLDNGYGVSRAQQKHTRNEEDMKFTRHLLAFRPVKSFKEQMLADATPEIVLVSSHDGTTAFSLFVGMFRFMCANGLIAGDTFAGHKIVHRGDAATKMVDKSNELMDNYVPKLKTWCDQAQDTTLSKKKMTHFATEAMKIRHGEGQPYDPQELLIPRRPEDDKPTVWHTYNRIQENLMKGGGKSTSAAGRVGVLKPINRVTKDVIYNQKLWDLAGGYLKAA